MTAPDWPRIYRVLERIAAAMEKANALDEALDAQRAMEEEHQRRMQMTPPLPPERAQ